MSHVQRLQGVLHVKRRQPDLKASANWQNPKMSDVTARQHQKQGCLAAGPSSDGVCWFQLVFDHHHSSARASVDSSRVVLAYLLSAPRRQESSMVSEDSGDIWHHSINMDNSLVSDRCSEQRGLLGFAGLDLLQPGPSHHSLVVHMLHSCSSDGVLRLSLRSVLLRG